MILVTHDLGVVAEMADREFMLAYAGRFVEKGNTEEILGIGDASIYSGPP